MRNMLRRTGLTVKMLIFTALLGAVLWMVSDNYQTRTLTHLFHEKLAERFSNEAQEHRTLFDRQIKIYSQAAKILVSSQMLHDYLQQTTWVEPSLATIHYHHRAPAWMPNHSILRQFVMPRYTLLLDSQGRVREVYNWDRTQPATELLSPSVMLLALSVNQSYLTKLNDGPYLVSSEPVLIDGEQVATLMLASPLDSQFLRDSQTLSTTRHTVALLSEESDTIIVSSDPIAAPGGMSLSALSDTHRTVGRGFFDYGSSDFVIRFASFIPLQEVNDLTRAVLDRARQQRSLVTTTFVLVFMLLIYMLTRRLRVMTERVVEFSNHMAIRHPKSDTRDELAILEDRFKTLASTIIRETEALEYQASHDPLTDLPNRKLLNERLQSALMRSEVTHKPLVLMLSDLDHFKEINDTLGHHVGDLVLQQAAERLYNTVRKTDTVARLGGDEFSILLPDANLQQATLIAEQIGRIFDEPFYVEEHELKVGISIGIAESPSHGDDVNILMQRADVAMYHAKQNGYIFAVYDPSTDTHHVSRLELLTDLRRAIEYGELEPHYQCKLDIRSGKIIGTEALLRWKHPERGMIHPDEIIPLAEQTGLIRPLTNLVLKRALQECARWREHGFELTVAVNMSAQCLRDNTLIDTLSQALEEYKLPPFCFILELTESDIMTDPIRAKNILTELNAIGVGIAVDDFGTGYSSLAYLKQLPVSEIKIDRSFVMEMLEDDNDLVIVRTIIDLAHNLGMSVVAEGVTSKTALNVLGKLGCDEAQGFFIDKPISSQTLLQRLLAKPSMAASSYKRRA
ncbi:MAG: EAL domain-containing protein [Gammaproteobacteria bacterium]|nr:EAL domain-containing protein [Gammaproteobacteria bacterium]